MYCPRCGKLMKIDITPSDAGPEYDLKSFYCDNDKCTIKPWIDSTSCAESKKFGWVRYQWTEDFKS